jgi:hypothetical protein
LREEEARYIGHSDAEDDGGEGENREEPLRDSEWFTWTKLLLRLSKEMCKDVDSVTAQPYVRTLFWLNFFKLLDEQNYILMKKHG